MLYMWLGIGLTALMVIAGYVVFAAYTHTEDANRHQKLDDIKDLNKKKPS